MKIINTLPVHHCRVHELNYTAENRVILNNLTLKYLQFLPQDATVLSYNKIDKCSQKVQSEENLE